jgi:hypothetical protein
MRWDSSGYYCPNQNCRWSDSQVSRYTDSIGSYQAFVARPATFAVGDSGTIIIDQSFPHFVVGNKLLNAHMIVGMKMDKVGQRTGWTRGQITQTCSDESFNYPFYGTAMLLCQNVASYYRGGGDSGAPVILTAMNDSDVPSIGIVHAAGLHVGGSTPTRSVFSPMQNIEYELGALKVCDWANNC